MTIQEMVISLFFIIDPIGLIPLEISLLDGIEQRRRRRIVIRECFIALGIMLIFIFFGKEILAYLHISTASATIAGGVIIFLMALKMVFPPALNLEVEKREPLIVPIATPLFAGPGLLSTIMLFAHRQINVVNILIAVIIAWFLASAVILSSQYISRILGKNAIEAIERLFGLVLTIMSINMMAEGIFEIIRLHQ
ncbi:MAG TPA: MarC family protein [Ignavibacteria bacterium]|jgi:MarC family membrane protein